MIRITNVLPISSYFCTFPNYKVLKSLISDVKVDTGYEALKFGCRELGKRSVQFKYQNIIL